MVGTGDGVTVVGNGEGVMVTAVRVGVKVMVGETGVLDGVRDGVFVSVGGMRVGEAVFVTVGETDV